MRCLTGLLLLLLVVTRPAAAQDAFEQQRAAALARMRGVDPIYLTFENGRSTYRIGERISLRVEFTPIGQAGVVYQGCPGAGLQVVLDRTDVDTSSRGIPDAQDVTCGVIGGIYGALAPQLAVSGSDVFYDIPAVPPRVHEAMELTADVQFTTPGRYRFYVRSRFDTPQAYGTPPRLSNILTIDIAARDAEWEAAALTKAAADLASGDLKQRWNAFGDLGLLGTDGAVDVAAKDSSDALTNVAPSAANRPHAIRRMFEHLDDVTRPVDWRFIWTLAALDATMHGTAPVPPEAVEARLRAHSARRLGALETHGQLESALGAAMFHAAAARGFGDRVMWQVPAAGFSAVPDAVSRALLALPPTEQRVVLAESLGWRDFADPAFLPMFRRIAQDRRPGGAQDVAWAMWHRLEPAAARTFALREIAAPGAVLGTSGLPGLGDSLRPSLDAPLVARLEAATTDAEFLRVASLIERFATGRLRANVAQVFERAPRATACPQGPVLLAYFFRVDPAYAETQLDRIGRVLDTTRERCADDGLLPAVAKRRTLPAVEAAALKRLRDPRPWVAVDAAEALAKEGGPAGKPALLAALDAWHAAWAPRAAMLQGGNLPFELDWAASAGPRLARALAEANAWRLTAADIEHIASRLFNERERSRFQGNASAYDETLDIDVWPPRRPDEPPTFFLPGAILARGVEALRARLALWPAGTHWRIATRSGFGSTQIPGLHPTALWLPGEEAATSARVRASMRPLGMTLSVP